MLKKWSKSLKKVAFKFCRGCVIFKTLIPRCSQYVPIFPPLSDGGLKDESAQMWILQYVIATKRAQSRFYISAVGGCQGSSAANGAWSAANSALRSAIRFSCRGCRPKDTLPARLPKRPIFSSYPMFIINSSALWHAQTTSFFSRTLEYLSVFNIPIT
jgi:hypothetical protein